VSILENGGYDPAAKPNAAKRLVKILVDSDVVKKIGSLLEQRYMKEVHVQYR